MAQNRTLDSILDEARQQLAGRTLTTTCPACGGGPKQRRTFSVTRRDDGLALYFCHRATCGMKGMRALGPPDYGPGAIPLAEFEPRVFDKPYRMPTVADPIGVALRETGVVEYGGDLDDFARATHLRVSSETPGTVIWRIHNAHGEMLGHSTRTSTKIVRTWREVAHPWYAAFGDWSQHKRQSVAIVEDCHSAASLYPHRAIALMGCHLSASVAYALTDGLKGLVANYAVALDPDAFESSAPRVVSTLAARGVTAGRVWIGKDVKNMSRTERETFIETVYG